MDQLSNTAYKCIYCGASQNLSVSDIFPDCLTNAKIRCRFVCKDLHNSKFSDEFENEACSYFAFVANCLNIKNSKTKLYPEYSFSYVVDGKIFPTRSRKLFPSISDRVLSLSSEAKIGPLGTLIHLRCADNEEYSRKIDLDQDQVFFRFSGHAQDFYSMSVSRLVAKIAYEWICFRQCCFGPLRALSSLAAFVEGSQSVNPVRAIWDSVFYQKLSGIVPPGNHFLFFIKKDNHFVCFVSMFGFMCYQIDLGDFSSDCFTYKFVFEYLDNYSCKNYVLRTKDEKEFLMQYDKALHANVSSYDAKTGRAVCFPNSIVLSYTMADRLYSFLSTEDIRNCDDTNTQNRLIIEHFQYFRSFLPITKQSLLRFCNEEKTLVNHGAHLDPRGDNPRQIILLYLVMKIGQLNLQPVTDEVIAHLVNSIFPMGNDGTPKMGDGFYKKIKNEMMAIRDKEKNIDKGFAIILMNKK